MSTYADFDWQDYEIPEGEGGPPAWTNDSPPERIWLQWYAENDLAQHEDASEGLVAVHPDDRTFCDNQINRHDVGYVRVDVLAKQKLMTKTVQGFLGVAQRDRDYWRDRALNAEDALRLTQDRLVEELSKREEDLLGGMRE